MRLASLALAVVVAAGLSGAAKAQEEPALPEVHWPFRHVSGSVHGSPSVQRTPSSTGEPWHLPRRHMSALVHWLSSVHDMPSGAMVPTQRPPAQ